MKELTHLLTPCDIYLSLIQTLASLSLFTQTLTHTRSHPHIRLSPEAFSNDLYTLEHSLLAFPSTLPSSAHEPTLSVALRIAGLIYLKSVLQEFPHSVNGSRILVERLRENLSLIWVGEEDGKLALVRWMCFVAAAVATGDAREWFVGNLGWLGLDWTGEEEVRLAKLLRLQDVFGGKAMEGIQEEVRMDQWSVPGTAV